MLAEGVIGLMHCDGILVPTDLLRESAVLIVLDIEESRYASWERGIRGRGGELLANPSRTSLSLPCAPQKRDCIIRLECLDFSSVPVPFACTVVSEQKRSLIDDERFYSIRSSVII